MKEVLRRLKNFFIGPRLVVGTRRDDWLMAWGILPQWYSSEGWHFTKVGVTIYFFSRRLDIYWTDNN